MKDSAYSLADTWRLNQRVNLFLLDQLSDSQLAWCANARARNIGDQFGHLHNVRIMWLEVAAPAAAKTLRKIGNGAARKAELRTALEGSSEAVAELIAEGERTGKIKSFPRGVAGFFGYMMAHEGHHRGQLVLHLKNAGMPIDKTASYALWE